jgi:hypothetical protein
VKKNIKGISDSYQDIPDALKSFELLHDPVIPGK